MARPVRSGKSPVTWGIVMVLLAVAIIGALWVPIYARYAPKLGDFPFFYSYQLILVPVTDRGLPGLTGTPTTTRLPRP